jgi:glycerate-2-kinase
MPEQHSRALGEALSLSAAWYEGLELSALMSRQLDWIVKAGVGVDVLALGKAAREMMTACEEVLAPHIRRRFLVCDEESAARAPFDHDVHVGNHPIVAARSLACGNEILEFLRTPSDASFTLFLISGGASSLCAKPIEPMDTNGLKELWDAVVTSGADITTLNKLRAATSRLSGGAVLRDVQTPRSASVIMVDNVVSGAPWVASGLTYDYLPDESELDELVSAVGLDSSELASNIYEASRLRATIMARHFVTTHENMVLVEPSDLLRRVTLRGEQLGYHVVDMGSRVQGTVTDVAEQWSDVLRRLSPRGGPLCVVGVGEVTVEVKGEGLGGRCQELAWRMAPVLADVGRPSSFVARSSDGRDYVAGVGGAWSDETSMARMKNLQIDFYDVLDRSDTYHAHLALDQVMMGGHTGWNLCDIYVAVLLD